MTKNLLFVSFSLFAFQSFSSDLIKAVREGRLKECEKLINEGVDINQTNQARETPLFVAARYARYGRLEIARLLLNSGAEIDKANNSGTTPIGRAVEEKHLEMVKLLLDHGSEVNKYCGCTPLLYLAVESHELSMVKLLLDYGAEVDQDSFYVTPLGKAIIERRVEIAKLLLANGADTSKMSFRKIEIPEDIRKSIDKYNTLKSLVLSKNIQLPNIQRIDKINNLLSLIAKEDSSQNYEYNNFPNEVWLLIISNLNDPKDYLRLILVSKYLYQVSTTPNVIKHFMTFISLGKKIRYLGKHNIEIPLAITWEDVEKFAKDNSLEF